MARLRRFEASESSKDSKVTVHECSADEAQAECSTSVLTVPV